MKTKLAANEVFRQFEVLDIQKLDFSQMLQSQIPEEIILAILCDYKDHQGEQIIRTIIQKLQVVSQSPNELEKYVLQLAFLSDLRNLGEETFKIAEHMSISFNIENSFLYKKGIAKNQEELEAKDKELAAKDASIRLGVVNLLLSKLLTDQQIADFLNLSIEYVQEIKDSIS